VALSLVLYSGGAVSVLASLPSVEGVVGVAFGECLVL